MTAQDRLVGALIGLSRAVDNNEHLITPDTNAALLRALTAATSAECEAALTAVQQQKRLLAPNCFDCASPCGRTADCDFPALLDAAPDARDARLSLLDALRTLARAQSTPDPEACAFLYRALFALGTETYAPADLQPYQNEAETRLHP
ncbi:MAG: hypothetical protein SPE01_06275 [Candidatus Spyradocola sp.]|nr:hypothetical protein [Candidatus Spyradocola sp.]